MIFVSAGHHPEKPGACYGHFCEFPETVAWRDRIVELLGDQGVKVPRGYLRNKAAFINSRCPDGVGIAAEIHFNAAADADGNNIGRGSETLHFPGSQAGIHVAKEVQRELSALAAFQPDRGVKEGWYRMDPKYGVDFFLRKIIAPAVIIEPQFIQHVCDIQKGREAGCKAIARALLASHAALFPSS